MSTSTLPDFVAQAKTKAKEDETSYRIAASALAKEQPDLHAAYLESIEPQKRDPRSYR